MLMPARFLVRGRALLRFECCPGDVDLALALYSFW